MKYRELLTALKQGTVRPLYLFSGEEAYQMQEAVDLIISTTVDEGARDFNLSQVYCRETSVADLINLCETLPFMAERRTVIAREIDAFKAADLEALLGYLRSPSPSTCLVLISDQRRYDKKQVVHAVEAAGVVTVFYPLLDREIPGWIDDWVRSRKLSIRPDAATFLWQRVGNDLQKLNNELEKAVLYVRERKTITFEDVRAVTGDFREFTSFDLAEAIGRKDQERAFLVLTRLLHEGEQPVPILGSVAWNFRRLLQAKSMEAAGVPPDDITRKLRVIFHQVRQFREQVRKYPVDELRQAFATMLAADKALKSGGIPGRLVLERMIMRLCGGS